MCKCFYILVDTGTVRIFLYSVHSTVYIYSYCVFVVLLAFILLLVARYIGDGVLGYVMVEVKLAMMKKLVAIMPEILSAMIKMCTVIAEVLLAMMDKFLLS